MASARAMAAAEESAEEQICEHCAQDDCDSLAGGHCASTMEGMLALEKEQQEFAQMMKEKEQQEMDEMGDMEKSSGAIVSSFPKSTACPPALEILAGSMPYIVADRI